MDPETTTSATTDHAQLEALLAGRIKAQEADLVALRRQLEESQRLEVRGRRAMN
jgi:hypothetical protein